MLVRLSWRVWALAGLLTLAGTRAPADDAVETRMRRDVTFLASDQCEGRGVNTKGINLAADYIAGQFKQAGLRPGGPNGSYFQPFTMSGAAKLGSPNVVSLHGPDGKEIVLKLDDGFRVLGLSGAGKVTAPLVFAGYGITAKELGYDDYQGLDVAGKVVLVLRKTPQPGSEKSPFAGDKGLHFAALTTKMVNADLHKAAAVIFVNDRDTAAKTDDLMTFAYTASAGAPTKLPAVHIHRATADKLLESGLGASLGTIEDRIDHSLKPAGAPLEGWTATVEATVNRPTLAVKNIVAVKEGSGPLANQTVVVGAHYDHLGYGERFSLAANLKKPAIHHGADDNASGTTALMELARRFGKMEKYEGRRIVFIAFSGEESGLLGSEYYCKNPLFPLADTAAMVNMDMVGRLRADKSGLQAALAFLTPGPGSLAPLAATAQARREHLFPVKDLLIVQGVGTAKGFGDLIDAVNKDFGFKLAKKASGFGPSDHASFYQKKIPVFFFFTGDHPDYHRPSDTADKINVPGMRHVTDLVQEVVERLAETTQRPLYVKVADSPQSTSGFSGPRIGIRPSYNDDKEGVLLDGVVEGGPAARAGLKEGDRIVEIAGKPVKSLEGYMVLLRGVKKGDPLELGILRAGKKTVVKVQPTY